MKFSTAAIIFVLFSLSSTTEAVFRGAASSSDNNKQHRALQNGGKMQMDEKEIFAEVDGLEDVLTTTDCSSITTNKNGACRKNGDGKTCEWKKGICSVKPAKQPCAETTGRQRCQQKKNKCKWNTTNNTCQDKNVKPAKQTCAETPGRQRCQQMKNKCKWETTNNTCQEKIKCKTFLDQDTCTANKADKCTWKASENVCKNKQLKKACAQYAREVNCAKAQGKNCAFIDAVCVDKPCALYTKDRTCKKAGGNKKNPRCQWATVGNGSFKCIAGGVLA